MTKFLMVQGTSSNAGKSSMVTALCRILSDMGYRVAPFKAQNMSSNLHITKDGLEMAKAQAIQAIAARTEPSPYMNPILLKPLGDYVSRVVLVGKMYRDMHAKYYYSNFIRKGMHYVKQAIKKLSKYDIVVIEGAGSPAEINIMDQDIANMRIAKMLEAPVLMVADIERGGCFASIVGTMHLLRPLERKFVKGFIINKFRGDKTILDPAIKSIEKITKKPVLGIIPFIDDMLLPKEDSLGIVAGRPEHEQINIAIIKYPNAVNLTDFDSLVNSSGVINSYHVSSSAKLSNADLVLLPSSRNIIDDLKWIQATGIGDSIRSLGKPIIGICEGFVMMGKHIQIGGIKMDGLALVDTMIFTGKAIAGNVGMKLTTSKAMVSNNGEILNAYLRSGYRVIRGNKSQPLFHIVRLNDNRVKLAEGAIRSDGLAFGCQLYGLFDTPPIRNSVIAYLARKKKIKVEMHEMEANQMWDSQIQRLSRTVLANINMERIRKLVEL